MFLKILLEKERKKDTNGTNIYCKPSVRHALSNSWQIVLSQLFAYLNDSFFQVSAQKSLRQTAFPDDPL